jgi:hypothetical protein
LIWRQDRVRQIFGCGCLKKGMKRGHRHPGCIGNCLEIWRDNDAPLRSLFSGNCMARRTDLANVDAAASKLPGASWVLAA